MKNWQEVHLTFKEIYTHLRGESIRYFKFSKGKPGQKEGQGKVPFSFKHQEIKKKFFFQFLFTLISRNKVHEGQAK